MSEMDPIAAARALIEPLTGYTPAPWRQGQNNPDRVSKGGEYIANCNPTHQSHPRTENNARLIAAAPDLRDMVATLADALEAERAESERLRGIIDKMDQHSPRADRTCAEPGITLSEAVMREWPELAEPKDEVSE